MNVHRPHVMPVAAVIRIAAVLLNPLFVLLFAFLDSEKYLFSPDGIALRGALGAGGP